MVAPQGRPMTMIERRKSCAGPGAVAWASRVIMRAFDMSALIIATKVCLCVKNSHAVAFSVRSRKTMGMRRSVHIFQRSSSRVSRHFPISLFGHHALFGMYWIRSMIGKMTRSWWEQPPGLQATDEHISCVFLRDLRLARNYISRQFQSDQVKVASIICWDP